MRVTSLVSSTSSVEVPKKVGPLITAMCQRPPGPLGLYQLHQACVCRQDVTRPPAPSPPYAQPLREMACMRQSKATGGSDVVREGKQAASAHIQPTAQLPDDTDTAGRTDQALASSSESCTEDTRILVSPKSSPA